MSDTERDFVVPQADNLDLVFSVASIVAEGARYRSDVSDALQYANRQGDYYTDAALGLGLIQSRQVFGTVRRDALELTELGRRYTATAHNQRAELRRQIVLDSPVVRYVAAELGTTSNGRVPFPVPDALTDVKQVAPVLEDLGLTQRTAKRRAYTIRAWLRAL